MEDEIPRNGNFKRENVYVPSIVWVFPKIFKQTHIYCKCHDIYPTTSDCPKHCDPEIACVVCLVHRPWPGNVTRWCTGPYDRAVITCAMVKLHTRHGKHTKNDGKSPRYQWVNPLFLWQFSIVFCMFTRGYLEVQFQWTKWMVFWTTFRCRLSIPITCGFIIMITPIYKNWNATAMAVYNHRFYPCFSPPPSMQPHPWLFLTIPIRLLYNLYNHNHDTHF